MTDEQARLIADIYRAAVEPAEWQVLLDRLCKQTGARGSALVAVDLSGRYGYEVTYGNSLYPPEMMREYEATYAHHEEAHFTRVAASPTHSICYDDDFPAVRSGALCRPDVDFLSDRFGVFERFAVKVSDDRSWFDCLTFQYATERGNASPTELGALMPCLPHVAEAMVLSRSFFQLK